MSNDQKQQIGVWVTWLLRVLTAVGGIFLLDAHSMLKENNALLNEHLIRYATDVTAIKAELQYHAKELERYRNERENRQHYYQQSAR